MRFKKKNKKNPRTSPKKAQKIKTKKPTQNPLRKTLKIKIPRLHQLNLEGQSSPHLLGFLEKPLRNVAVKIKG